MYESIKDELLDFLIKKSIERDDIIEAYSELIDKLEEEKELYKGNYNTCLKALAEYDKDLKEYLESKGKK